MNDRGPATRFKVTLRFHGDLPFFLKRAESHGQVARQVLEKTSVKDVIESCGVPHTEVDLIVCDGALAGFGHQLSNDAIAEVYGVGSSPEAFAESRLQRRDVIRFVVDGHLGKLARDLRLLGLDTMYRNDADDAALVQAAVTEERALLTRDRRLLMHAVVQDGYSVRSDDAEEQIVEVLRRFDVAAAVRPYTRCLRCNGALAAVPKSEVMDRLEPLTKIYYEEFRRCTECRHIYWSGSHYGKLEARLTRIRETVASLDAARRVKWA